MKGKIIFLVVLVVLSVVVIAEDAPSRKILIKTVGAASDAVGVNSVFARRHAQIDMQKARRYDALREQRVVRQEKKASYRARIERIQAKRAGPEQHAGSVTRFKPSPVVFPVPKPSKFRTNGWYQG